MFSLNEEDEEDDPSRCDSGKDFIFKSLFKLLSKRGYFLRSLFLDVVLILELVVHQL